MHVEIKDWKNGWYGIDIGLAEQEIDQLIHLLNMIKEDPEQHFHISSDDSGEDGVGDIEIYIKEADTPDNMALMSLALGPGDEI
jgi:hypothetical protein